MEAGRGTVFLSEDDDISDGEWWYLGTFAAFHGSGGSPDDEAYDLSFGEALAWADVRSDQVWLTTADGDRVWVGRADPPKGFESARARLEADPPRRRRHPAFRFLDRTPDDPPIGWTVTAWVDVSALPGGTAHPPRSPGLDAAMARFAETAGAVWDRRSRDRFMRDLDAEAARHPERATFGWTSGNRSEYRVRLEVEAATRDAAVDLARSRLRPDDGLRLDEVDAVPVGFKPLHGDPDR